VRDEHSVQCLLDKDRRFPVIEVGEKPFRIRIDGIRTAAVSTPVGPPPQTTNVNSRFRSSGAVVGSEAASKLSKMGVNKQSD
jgi:hypothetical protein